MDIRNWPLDRIMQLPDCCFGRRWPIAVSKYTLSIDTFYEISAEGLPDRCVIWEFGIWSLRYITTTIAVSLALGDAIPATDAEFDALPLLFPNIGGIIDGRIAIQTDREPHAARIQMRMPLMAQGRRLVARFQTLGAAAATLVSYIVVSSIPTEVPDWLCSAHQ